MAALGEDGDFAGKLRLPLPDNFSGQPADWEEWSWNFKAYISMFEAGAVTLLDNAEALTTEFTDAHLEVTLDTGHFASKCPLNRVNAVEGEESELYGLQEEESYFGEAPWDDWSEWTVGALFDESWESWDDSLWDSSWDSWDWYSYQDFAGWNEWWPEATSSKETLSPQQPQKPKEESTLQHGAQQAPVSAVTVTAPPGLSKAAPKPKAKSSLSPSSFLMSALVLGNFGVGQSFGFEGMLTGDVDFSYGEKRATFSSVGMAPLETFSLNRNDSVPQKLFSVYDLGVSNLNTTFRDHALEEHLVAATFDENEPWILFDSGAATHCCPQDFASEWPVELESLADERVTYLTYEDGRKETLHDNWRTSKDHSAEDTFRLRLAQAASGTLPDFQKALVEQLSEKDPATGEAFTHDRWLNFQLFWVRVHYVSRNTLYVPEDPHFEEELGNARMTLIMRPDAEPTWHFDLWRKYGTQEVTQDFVGATCFEKLPLEAFEAEPAQPEYLAQRPKGLKQPGEPTLTERLEHELTHLPFKPWCEICLKAKSRQAHSKKLSLRQPVLQMDFSFLSDKPGEEQVTILNVVDVLSNMALSVVIPTKARTPYSHAELRRFVLETGRTFGILQCDPEPALKAIAEAVTGEVGGLSLRSTPTGWKQAQGSVGNMQATLYGQIKALRLELLQRYQVDLSVHSALFTWLVRHAQWLVNRYLCNAAGTTAFERRWGKRYNGFICRFGETVLFRKQRVNKGKPAFERGVWLGKDTESEQHFVADSRGVYKTRSLKRLPPTQQSDVALLQSVTARPWDPTGAKVETDSFIFPMQQSEEATNLALPPSGQLSGPPEKGNDVPNYELSDPELEEALGLDGTEPVPARDDLSDLPEDYFSDVEQEPPLPPPEFEPPRLTLDEQTANAAQARSSTDAALPQPPGSRPRLSDESPASPTKRSTETFDVGTTKVQRINAVTFYSGRKRIPKPLYVELSVADLQKDLLLKMTGTLDEGQSVTFLGRELQRTNDAILVGMNPAYIDRMLETAGLSGCKPVLAPGTDTLRKQLNVEPLDAEAHKRYRRIVGQLLWLSSVRPDIMYAVKELSRGLSAPTSEHEAKAKHLLKYLAGTKNFSQHMYFAVLCSADVYFAVMFSHVTFERIRRTRLAYAMDRFTPAQSRDVDFSTYRTWLSLQLVLETLWNGLQKEQLYLPLSSPAEMFQKLYPLIQYAATLGLYTPPELEVLQRTFVGFWTPERPTFRQDWVPFQLWLTLPTGLWLTVASAAQRSGNFVLPSAAMVGTMVDCLNLTLSPRSSLLFWSFGLSISLQQGLDRVTFMPGEQLITIGVRLLLQDFTRLITINGNRLWNRRYVDYFLKVQSLNFMWEPTCRTIVTLLHRIHPYELCDNLNTYFDRPDCRHSRLMHLPLLSRLYQELSNFPDEGVAPMHLDIPTLRRGFRM
ncbi:RE1 [Symbiodinium natans]|uniref:RE1 protein n=1 Tax=Symbiodinium natans TaxID=878477 RepID=A0A812I1R6_9DINO|nr:RE1 [Symbiodinium natans]